MAGFSEETWRRLRTITFRVETLRAASAAGASLAPDNGVVDDLGYLLNLVKACENTILAKGVADVKVQFLERVEAIERRVRAIEKRDGERTERVRPVHYGSAKSTSTVSGRIKVVYAGGNGGPACKVMRRELERAATGGDVPLVSEIQSAVTCATCRAALQKHLVPTVKTPGGIDLFVHATDARVHCDRRVEEQARQKRNATHYLAKSDLRLYVTCPECLRQLARLDGGTVADAAIRGYTGFASNRILVPRDIADRAGPWDYLSTPAGRFELLPGLAFSSDRRSALKRNDAGTWDHVPFREAVDEAVSAGAWGCECSNCSHVVVAISDGGLLHTCPNCRSLDTMQVIEPMRGATQPEGCPDGEQSPGTLASVAEPACDPAVCPQGHLGMHAAGCAWKAARG